MTSELDLHTFARRYCIDRIDYWQERYAPIDEAAFRNMGARYEYTDKAYDIYPRYNVLDAILLEVESFDPEALPQTLELEKLLVGMGYRANSELTGNHSSPIAQQAEEDERLRFVEAVETAATRDLRDQQPLFYRRVLDSTEVAGLWQDISVRWGAKWLGWYPLGDRTHPSLVAMKLWDVDVTKLDRALKKFIGYPGAERVFQLREYGRDNYVLDGEAAVFRANFAEGYWFSRTGDWIIHCSHENTITLGGTIASVARKRFPAAMF